MEHSPISTNFCFSFQSQALFSPTIMFAWADYWAIQRRKWAPSCLCRVNWAYSDSKIKAIYEKKNCINQTNRMNTEDNMLIGEVELCIILKLWECICLGATVIIYIFHCHYFKKLVLKFVSFCFYHCMKHEIKWQRHTPQKRSVTYTAFTRK